MGIVFPFPQMTLSYEQQSDNYLVTNKVKKQVEAFVDEQKDLSRDIDDRK